MRRPWVLLLGITALGGCDNGTPAPAGEAALLPEAAPSPTSLTPGKLALFAPTGEIQVGATADEAERLFPSPSGSFPLRELPSSFSEPYKARGYETYREGFGVILYGDRVALVLRRQEDRAPETADQVRAQYVTRFGAPNANLNDGKITYTFWYDEGGQRLMLCVTPDAVAKDKVDITVALGDTVVMDALRMNPIYAERDRAIGEKLLEQKPKKR